MRTLDAVVPIFNEAEILPELHRRLTSVLDSLPLEWRILYVDDGSSDASAGLLAEYASQDRRVCVLHLARNFGQQPAIAAGLAEATADAVVLLDGDLQDPPEVIPELVRAWEEGNDVVYAVKRKRKESLPKRSLFSLYYYVLGRLSSVDIPANAGNFSLMDRSVVAAINSMPEHNRYVSGLRAYVGGRQAGVEFERAARFAGEPRQSPLKLGRMAVDAFVSYSEVPLRLVTAMGFRLGFRDDFGPVHRRNPVDRDRRYRRVRGSDLHRNEAQAQLGGRQVPKSGCIVTGTPNRSLGSSQVWRGSFRTRLTRR